MQNPRMVNNEINKLTCNESTVLKNSFYSVYLGKRDRCYNSIESLLYCYRVFKEARNCYMHHNSCADDKLVKAYLEYAPHATPTALCVSEIPEFSKPVLNGEIKISLCGVVGLSYIIIKILVSLDTELLRARNAEAEFISRFKKKHTPLRTLKGDVESARRQVKQYVKQCEFAEPRAIDELTTFLHDNHLIAR